MKAEQRQYRTPLRTAWIPLLLVLVGCRSAPVADAESALEPGGPFPGLTDAERARFEAGRSLFDRVFRPEEGLGPLFNENQCSACHTEPASGGSGEQFAVRMTRFEAPDRCDLIPDHGGENVQSNATPLLQALGFTGRPEPPGVTERGRFFTPFLFGLGLAEAIPDEVILSREDPDDRDGDGISGRAGRTASGATGRFGRKAEHAAVADFVAGAALLEMGLTSPSQPREPVLNGAPMPAEADPVADPELDAESLARLADFVRFLAPLPRRIPEDAARQADIADGEELFTEIGCASCHTPVLETGPSPARALDRKRARLYSDFLLHDMGPELAGACGIAASPGEYRTESLAGLGYRRRFLHDARSRSLHEAIRLHGGEAVRVRAAFETLDPVTQERLIRFLQSL